MSIIIIIIVGGLCGSDRSGLSTGLLWIAIEWHCNCKWLIDLNKFSVCLSVTRPTIVRDCEGDPVKLARREQLGEVWHSFMRLNFTSRWMLLQAVDTSNMGSQNHIATVDNNVGSSGSVWCCARRGHRTIDADNHVSYISAHGIITSVGGTCTPYVPI